MQTEAVFENIANRIISEISLAKKSIYIAVAWFTNQRIFNILIKKAENGCQINLIYSADQINDNSKIDFNSLNIRASKAFRIGDGDKILMHNKFCVIDHCTIITGSYNWSYKAETNFENIIITKDDTTLAVQFISEFYKIKKKFYPKDEEEIKYFPLDKIIKQIEILKNYILLEEIEELKKYALKLQIYNFNTDIVQILNLIEKEDLETAIKTITDFISNCQQTTIWTDPEIAELKLEIHSLQNEINAFDNERIELEKILSNFHYCHSKELGPIILKILKLRKQKYKYDKEN
ncbi:phospholipase D-like domain-containing protein, partial [Algoriphagus sp. A40]|uniref:phospholipase D-like domain-containing protein n=1 Tax=Algoriphagus sp. A40 TaxID=1945863 RepID=UPI0009CAB6F6